MMHRVEGWAPPKKMQIESAEMLFYRHLVRISWKGRRTYERSLKGLVITSELLSKINRKQLSLNLPVEGDACL